MLTTEMTKRGVTYIGYRCNCDCEICYYKFKPKYWKTLKEIKTDLIRQAKYYNLEHTDITGGEATIHPNIIEILKFCKTLNIKPTIITNGLVIRKEMDELVDDWLFSIHGVKADHNKIIGKDTFDIVIKNIDKIKKPFRLNCVITKYNYKRFEEYAMWIIKQKKKPTEVNFINFNPFGEWASQEQIDFLANPNDVGTYIKKAIDILEENNIIVNVRYLPHCFAKGFEKNVVGFSQVWADNKEWNWAHQLNLNVNVVNDKQFGYGCGRNTAVNNSCQLPECRECAWEFICDGVLMSYLKHFRDLKLSSIKGEKIFDPLYFQKERGEDRKVEPPPKISSKNGFPLPSSSKPK